MHLRDQSLRTGSLLAWFDDASRANNRGLLFMVRGADDIEPLGAIESACREHIAERQYQGFEWHPVLDQGQISSVDPELNVSRVERFEACEFRNLDDGNLRALLDPVLDRMAASEPDLLPRAGGAVGAAAEGVQFLDRSAELEELLSLLRSGRSVFLQAPRRSGKTSLMLRLQRKLRTEFTVVSVNLELDATPVEFAARLRILATGEGFRTAFRSVSEDPYGSMAASLAAIWRAGGEDKRLLLFLDEPVRLLDGLRPAGGTDQEHAREIETFLQGLGNAVSELKASLVIAGSLDLFDYLEGEVGVDRQRLPAWLRDIVPFTLRPLAFQFPEIELRRVLLGTGLVAETEDLAWLAGHVDLNLPFPALRFLDQLAGEARCRGVLTPQNLDEILQDFLATTDSFDDLQDHLLRKKPAMPRASETASEVLDLVAREPFEQGVHSERVRRLLERGVGTGTTRLCTWLLKTFPLDESGERVTFACRLFWQWWRRQLEEGRHDDE